VGKFGARLKRDRTKPGMWKVEAKFGIKFHLIRSGCKWKITGGKRDKADKEEARKARRSIKNPFIQV